MTIKGIDLASHQGPNFPFAKAKEQGFEFAIIKATGGHSYRNPYLGQQVAAARANNFALGYYHYMFEPSTGGGNMAMEYANFRDTVRSTWREGDSLWLDVEEYPQAVNFAGNLGDWIVDWCSRAEADFGVVPGIYCATWYLQPTGLNADERLRKYPFWCASWQADPPRGSFLAPWETITVWQYDAHYRGITGSDLDCNRFFGTREQFLALGTPKKVVAEVVKDTLADPAKAAPTGGVNAFINERGEAVVVVNFGGVATGIEGVNFVDLGVSVRNADGEVFDRSIQGNVLGEWVQRGA